MPPLATEVAQPRRRPRRPLTICALSLCLLTVGGVAFAQSPVTYRVSFVQPQHHWMQVEAVFPDLPPGPLRVLMSRSSPGRYAIHEFARNVYDVRIDDGEDRALAIDRPNTSEWAVSGHAGRVRVRYRVFGDRTDGTFLSVDTTHAHINIPAALMWARGLENRPVRITFERPQGTSWKVATQMHPTDAPDTFTAPNLQYLVDSPTEVGDFALREFEYEQRFRIALHHTGNDREADAFAADVQRIVAEEREVFGELPAFENGYTFIADLLPAASWDGMEHRNSAVVTSMGSLADPDQRLNIVATVAHEFFHSWNVERIRPKLLEPFRLDGPNMSGELWLAEGFTSYYEPLMVHRAGLADLGWMLRTYGAVLDTVINSPARQYRSAEEMSRFAQFVDAATWTDRTNWKNTFISYYTWGAAIGLGLDLSLRVRSNGKVTLDDYMRVLWRNHGRPPAVAQGMVAHPYTMQDVRQALAEVSGDRLFADDFFARFIEGRDVVDYRQLLEHAGLMLRRKNPGRAWLGPVELGMSGGVATIVEPTLEGTPAHAAGLDRGDEIVSLDGLAIGTAGRLDEILRRHKPGDTVAVVIRRNGKPESSSVTMQEDPGLELVAAEAAGVPLSAAARVFRDAWLKSKVVP